MKKLGNIFVFISIGAMFLMPSNIVKADSAGSVTSKAGISFHGKNPIIENPNHIDSKSDGHDKEKLPALNDPSKIFFNLLGVVAILAALIGSKKSKEK